MSHFTVTALSRKPAGTPMPEVLADLEDLLAPYDENQSVEPYKDYLDDDHLNHITQMYAHVRAKIAAGDPETIERWDGAEVPEGDRVVDMLASYYECLCGCDEDGRYWHMSEYNPDSKWDWWQVGGRWRGYFPLKPGATGIVGESGSGDNDAQPNGADVVRKGDVDIERIRNEAEARAKVTWSRYWAIAEGTPDPTPWADFVARVKHGDLQIEEARQFYAAQPRVRALREHDAKVGWEQALLGIYGGPEDFGSDAEAFVRDARDSALATFATLTEKGWVEQGKMGWWAMTTDEADKGAWGRAWNEWFDALPDDAVLVALDCHI